MNNQDKISWYLSKGFAVQADEYRLYFASMACFVGLGEDGRYVSLDKLGQEVKEIKSIAPIPPKPYEFKVGERVIVLLPAYSNPGIVLEIENNIFVGFEGGDVWFNRYELAPALPEDDECEVVEVTKICFDNLDEFTATKADGKKLKIKVIKQ